MTYRYPVVLQRDDDAWTVRFPDLPEAITFGDSVEFALRAAVDCLDEALASRIADGEDIPAPSRLRKYAVEPSLLIAAKTALYEAVTSAGVRKTALARRMDLNENEIRRMLDPHHPTKLGRIERALAVLGKRLSLSVVDVPPAADRRGR